MDAHRSTFLGSIGEQALAALESMGAREAMAPGASVLHEGEPALRLAVVRSGLVKVVARQAGHAETVLAIRGPGELVGELGVFDGQPRSASAVAILASDVQYVSTEEFQHLVSSHPRVALALIRMLVSRLRESDAHRVSVASDGVARRLARALLQMAAEQGGFGEDGSVTIELPLTQEDLASMLSASRDAVAKALKTWRDQGLVVTGRRKITLLDPATLSRRQRL